MTPRLPFIRDCSHYNELYLAGLGPPEAQVMLIGRYCIVTGLGLTKDRFGGQASQRLVCTMTLSLLPYGKMSTRPFFVIRITRNVQNL